MSSSFQRTNSELQGTKSTGGRITPPALPSFPHVLVLRALDSAASISPAEGPHAAIPQYGVANWHLCTEI